MTKIKHAKVTNPIEKQFEELTRYHYYIFCIIFASLIPIFWHVLNLIFLSPPMDYYCGDNSTKNKCPCDQPSWDRSVFKETMQTKFTILCDSNWMISFSQSIIYGGMLIGALTLGFLSDKYGRLPMFSVSCLFLASFGCLVSAMPSAGLFMLMRFFEGIGAGGAAVTGYVLCIEYCGLRHREVITAMFNVPVNIGHVTLPGISYLLRKYDELQIAVSAPLFLFVATNWILMESPKWLMDNGYINKAIDVMEKFAKFNGTPFANIREDIEDYISNQTAGFQNEVKFWQIFKHKKLCINFCSMGVNYFSCGLGFYGVSQYIGKMSGNIHLNVFLSGMLLLPGTIASVFLLKLLPRRLFLMTTSFLSGVFMLIVISVPVRFNWLRIVIACICNCFFFMSFITVFLYSVELFPTAVRNSALGLLSVLSRVGQMTAPPVNALSEMVSGIIYGVMAIIGAILCIVLPETKNVELPSSFEDCESLPRSPRHLEEDVDRLQLNIPETKAAK